MKEYGLDSITRCTLCGSQMTHYRLYGYQCRNPEHKAILNELRQRAGWDDDKFRLLLAEERKKRGF